MKTKRIIIGLTAVFILIPVLLLLYSINKAPKAEVAPQESIVTAKELHDAFKSDKAAALEKYSGEPIVMKGFVTYTGPDVYALPSVELSESKDGKSRLLCVLPFSDFLELRKVSKGDEVLIRGEVRGFYEKADQVVVKQCEIVENTNNK